MTGTSSSQDPHVAFTEWALENGVIAYKVRPHHFEGRGLGMIAIKDIRKGDTVVQVPTTLILNVERIPTSFKAEFPEGIANHALIAAWLTHRGPDDLKDCHLWFDTWPKRQEFEDTLPILWPVELGGRQWPGDEAAKPDSKQPNFIPPSISGRWNTFQRSVLPEQKVQEHQDQMHFQGKRLRKAYDDVCAARPDTDWRTFSYFWFILNTRSFYWVGDDQEPPEDRNEALAMVPFADYFNHTDVDCDVSFNGEEYVLKATKDYTKGEEVYMNYGSHSNDLLLGEYGFFLDENRDDCIYLDDIVFRDLDAEKQEELQLNQYHGQYVVTQKGVCYRTEVAAGLMYMKVEDWRSYVLEGSTDYVDDSKSEAIIKGWLSDYIKEANATIEAIEGALQSSPEVMAHRQKASTLLRRWGQIKVTCERALEQVNQ